jgi:hypothetical protein
MIIDVTARGTIGLKMKWVEGIDGDCSNYQQKAGCQGYDSFEISFLVIQFIIFPYRCFHVSAALAALAHYFFYRPFN